MSSEKLKIRPGKKQKESSGGISAAPRQKYAQVSERKKARLYLGEIKEILRHRERYVLAILFPSPVYFRVRYKDERPYAREGNMSRANRLRKRTALSSKTPDAGRLSVPMTFGLLSRIACLHSVSDARPVRPGPWILRRGLHSRKVGLVPRPTPPGSFRSLALHGLINSNSLGCSHA